MAQAAIEKEKERLSRELGEDIDTETLLRKKHGEELERQRQRELEDRLGSKKLKQLREARESKRLKAIEREEREKTQETLLESFQYQLGKLIDQVDKLERKNIEQTKPKEVQQFTQGAEATHPAVDKEEEVEPPNNTLLGAVVGIGITALIVGAQFFEGRPKTQQEKRVEELKDQPQNIFTTASATQWTGKKQTLEGQR